MYIVYTYLYVLQILDYGSSKYLIANIIGIYYQFSWTQHGIIEIEHFVPNCAYN